MVNQNKNKFKYVSPDFRAMSLEIINTLKEGLAFSLYWNSHNFREKSKQFIISWEDDLIENISKCRVFDIHRSQCSSTTRVMEFLGVLKENNKVHYFTVRDGTKQNVFNDDGTLRYDFRYKNVIAICEKK